jgi:hypothetical protein
MLKSIATGEYVPPEERQPEELPEEATEGQAVPDESEAAAPREKASESEETAPETELLIDPTNDSESKSES